MSWTDIAAAVKGALGIQPRPMPAGLPAAPEAPAEQPCAPPVLPEAQGPAANAGHHVEEIVTALYRGLFEREPDRSGFEHAVGQLHAGVAVEELVRGFLASVEFKKRVAELIAPPTELPDLTRAMPDRYAWPVLRGTPMPVYVAPGEADIALMESLIERHRYYDRFGVWSPVIDLDKEIIAAIVRGLGAHSCFELGCFTGPVLSLLADAGLRVVGSEVSHTAFVYAYPSIRSSMIYGDLLSIDLDRRFDVVLCMDVLEHISPLRLDAYIDRLSSLLEDDGYLYLNAPMWGSDRVFGLFEDQYLEEWRQVGDSAYWRYWPCDAQGWPAHGHLVWASPAWWERTFAGHGLVRDEIIERAIHARLAGFYDQSGGRRCLFVLRRRASRKSSVEVADAVGSLLATLPGLQPL